jgi:hypothetical protein
MEFLKRVVVPVFAAQIAPAYVVPTLVCIAALARATYHTSSRYSYYAYLAIFYFAVRYGTRARGYVHCAWQWLRAHSAAWFEHIPIEAFYRRPPSVARHKCFPTIVSAHFIPKQSDGFDRSAINITDALRMYLAQDHFYNSVCVIANLAKCLDAIKETSGGNGLVYIRYTHEPTVEYPADTRAIPFGKTFAYIKEASAFVWPPCSLSQIANTSALSRRRIDMIEASSAELRTFVEELAGPLNTFYNVLNDVERQSWLEVYRATTSSEQQEQALYVKVAFARPADESFEIYVA